MARKQKIGYDELYNAAIAMQRAAVEVGGGEDRGGMHYATGYMMSFFTALLDSTELNLTQKQKAHVLGLMQERSIKEPF